MNAPDAAAWGAAAAGLLTGGAGGLLVRMLIARLPEPEPEPEPEESIDQGAGGAEVTGGTPVAPAAEPVAPKVLYADIAVSPGLTGRAVLYGAFAGAVVGLSLGWTWALLLVLPLIPVATALGIVDARTRLLPTKLVLPATGAAILLGTAVAAIEGDADALLRAVIAMVVARSVFWVLWFIRSAGMGFGDVRLSAALGFVLGYLGWAELVVGLYAAFFEFVIPGLLLALVHRDLARLKVRIPFGPFLLLGALTGIAVGDQIVASLVS